MLRPILALLHKHDTPASGYLYLWRQISLTARRLLLRPLQWFWLRLGSAELSQFLPNIFPSLIKMSLHEAHMVDRRGQVLKPHGQSVRGDHDWEGITEKVLVLCASNGKHLAWVFSDWWTCLLSCILAKYVERKLRISVVRS